MVESRGGRERFLEVRRQGLSHGKAGNPRTVPEGEELHRGYVSSARSLLCFHLTGPSWVSGPALGSQWPGSGTEQARSHASCLTIGDHVTKTGAQRAGRGLFTKENQGLQPREGVGWVFWRQSSVHLRSPGRQHRPRLGTD